MKWETNEQDTEDFEQELRIREWLQQQNPGEQFTFEYISSKGTARNSLLRASVRLDQKISDDGSGTFADLIAGSDGRDLVGGGDNDDPQTEARTLIDGYLIALGFEEGDLECLVKILKLSDQENKKLFEKFLTDSE